MLTAPLPVSDAAPAVTLFRAGDRGSRRHAHAAAKPERTDDYGVKNVRFTSGATTLGNAAVPPYAQSVLDPG